MITPSYVRTMARYNSEMNRRVYAAAADLSDEQRKADRGLFWKSLHGTLNHLMWGDRQWMSRFDGWPANTVPNPGSPTLYADFDELRAERIKADAAIENLAGRVDEDDGTRIVQGADQTADAGERAVGVHDLADLREGRAQDADEREDGEAEDADREGDLDQRETAAAGGDGGRHVVHL